MEGACCSVSNRVCIRGALEATTDSFVATLETLHVVNSFTLRTTRSSIHFWFFTVISKDDDDRI